VCLIKLGFERKGSKGRQYVHGAPSKKYCNRDYGCNLDASVWQKVEATNGQEEKRTLDQER